MKNYSKGFAVAAVIVLLFVSGVASGYNEVVEVPVDEEEEFTEPPDPNQDDQIKVTNPDDDRDIEIKRCSVKDDPRNDTAILEITSDTTVDVIRRGAVGALYEIEGDIDDGWWPPGISVLPWWHDWKSEVKDAIFGGGTLVLQDDLRGVSVADSGNGNGSPSIYCELDTNREGAVTFWLELEEEEGTYNWSVSGVDSGTLTADDYKWSLSGIDPGEYTLTVTEQGGDFERKIEFEVVGIIITDYFVRVTALCGGVTKIEKTELAKDIMKAVMAKKITIYLQARLTYLLSGMQFAVAMSLPTINLTTLFVEELYFEVTFDAYQSGNWEEGLTENEEKKDLGYCLGVEQDFDSLVNAYKRMYRDLAAKVIAHCHYD